MILNGREGEENCSRREESSRLTNFNAFAKNILFRVAINYATRLAVGRWRGSISRQTGQDVSAGGENRIFVSLFTGPSAVLFRMESV